MKLVSLALVLALAGCHGAGTSGSGHVKTDSRTVGAFDEIEASTGLDVDVHVGPSGPVIVEADDNIVPMIVTEVREHRLLVHVNGSVSPSHEIHVTVPAKDLKTIEASAGATLHVDGLANDGCAFSASSGADIEAKGASADIDVRVSSGASVKLAGLTAKTAKVQGSSGGTVALRVTDSVSGSLSSGASLDVDGAPKTRSVGTSSGASVHYR